MYRVVLHRKSSTLGQAQTQPETVRTTSIKVFQFAYRTTIDGLYQGIKLPPTVSNIAERNTLSGAPSNRLKSHEEFRNRRTAKPLSNMTQPERGCRLPERSVEFNCGHFSRTVISDTALCSHMSTGRESVGQVAVERRNPAASSLNQ